MGHPQTTSLQIFRSRISSLSFREPKHSARSARVALPLGMKDCLMKIYIFSLREPANLSLNYLRVDWASIWIVLFFLSKPMNQTRTLTFSVLFSYADSLIILFMQLHKVTFATQGPPLTHTRNLPNCAFRHGQISIGSAKPQQSGDDFEARCEEEGLRWLLKNRCFIQKQRNKVFQLLIFNIEKKRTSFHLEVHWATGYSICYVHGDCARFAVASVLHVLELHKRQKFMASFDQESVVASLRVSARYKSEQDLERALREERVRLGLIQLRVKQEVLQLRKQTLRQLDDRQLLEPLKSLQPLPSLDYLEFEMLQVSPLSSFFLVDLTESLTADSQAVLIGYHQHLGSVQFSRDSHQYGLTVGRDEDLILPLGLFINGGLSVGYLQIISENEFFVCYQGNTNFGSSGGPIVGAAGILAHNLGHFDDRLDRADGSTLAHFMECVEFERLVVRRREHSSKNFNVGLKLRNSFTRRLFERLKSQWIRL